MQLQTRATRTYRHYVAWLLISGIAVLIILRNPGIDAASNTLLTQKVARFRAMILIGGKLIERQLGSTAGNSIESQFRITLQQIENEAKTQQDEFRAAVIAGEIIGKEQALSLLETITPGRDAELAEDIAAVRTVYTTGPGGLPEARQNRLITRYGDIGKIVLAFGVAPEVEPRKSVEQAAFQVLLRSSLVVFGLMLMSGLSIAFFTLGLILRFRGMIRWAYVARPVPGSRYLEAFALYLILLLGIGGFLRLLGFQSPWWNWLLLLVPPLSLLWISKEEVNFNEVLQAVGLHRGKGWWREIGAGVMGYLGGLVFVVPCVFISYLLIRIMGTGTTHPIMSPLLQGGWWQVLGLYGLACILAPATEEIMFRGVLFHHLRSRWSWLVSAVLVSLIFAILHPQGWAAVPALGGIAIVLTAIREWRASLIASIAAHSLNNFVALTFALMLLR